ncbi:unnamed protein product [Onchocerca flexuosa]|uniref:STAS domain-containing protein n=1 Tax=Onchocerca flexuosa TaxID=387005 RepID=A0A183HUM2_9BILA|nr:unnamed protein product [Onchocerca flexuosa]
MSTLLIFPHFDTMSHIPRHVYADMSALQKMIPLIVLDLFLLIATVSADIYSSFATLKALIGAERDIPIMINGYVEKELERLDYLKK